MPKIRYQGYYFHKDSKTLIAICDKILTEYALKGYDLTLRQLYYQLVSQNILENCEASYKSLSKIVSKARIAGLLDWDHIVDRGRYLRRLSNWSNPQSIIHSAHSSYHEDWWKEQEYRPEIWVEKEALIGIAQKAGDELDVPYFTCKGFNSQSEMWAASQRFSIYNKSRQTPLVIYLGDHDPSGIDMSRDIEQRLFMFGATFQMERVALNYEQVESFKLPSNPAKKTDKRYKDYAIQFGDECWELDALKPEVLVNLIHDTIMKYSDPDLLDEAKVKEMKSKRVLALIANNFDKVVATLNEKIS